MVDLIGSGVSSNFKLTGRSDLEKLTGWQLLDDCLKTLIQTRSANRGNRKGGDRVYNRAIGLNLDRFLFKSFDDTTRAAIRREFALLSQFEPRVIIVEETIEVNKDSELNPGGDPHLVIVVVPYSIVRTGERRNLVVPMFTKDRFQVLYEEIRSVAA